MRFKMLFSVLALMIFLPLSAIGAGAPSIDASYTTLPGKEFKYDGKTLEVVEFMSFYCGHCYEFDSSIPVIMGNFPKKIKWTVIPIYWGEGSSKPGEAYMIAADAGKGPQMARAIFSARFREKKDIGDIATLEAIAAKVGLDFSFSRRLRSGEKAAEAQRALDMAAEYMVEETPTLVIANSLMTNPHRAGHDIKAFRDNAITIIKSIVE